MPKAKDAKKIREFDIYSYNTSTYYKEKLDAIVPLLSYVFDNTTNSFTGPVDGFKQYITFQFSPDIGSNSVQFQTFKFKHHKQMY